jgi:hypothetical protein
MSRGHTVSTVSNLRPGSKGKSSKWNAIAVFPSGLSYSVVSTWNFEPLNALGWLQRDGATSCVPDVYFYPCWYSLLCSPFRDAGAIGAVARTRIVTRRHHRAPDHQFRHRVPFRPPVPQQFCLSDVNDGSIIVSLTRSGGSDGSREGVCVDVTQSLCPPLPVRRV